MLTEAGFLPLEKMCIISSYSVLFMLSCLFPSRSRHGTITQPVSVRFVHTSVEKIVRVAFVLIGREIDDQSGMEKVK